MRKLIEISHFTIADMVTIFMYRIFFEKLKSLYLIKVFHLINNAKIHYLKIVVSKKLKSWWLRFAKKCAHTAFITFLAVIVTNLGSSFNRNIWDDSLAVFYALFNYRHGTIKQKVSK